MDEIIKIQKNIEVMEKYISILDEFKIDTEDEFKSKTHDNLAISMSLFTILNATIEIGEELISLKNLNIPLSYREIFTILSKSEVLPEEICSKMSKNMYYRNMIAHQYDEIDLSKIYTLFINRREFEDYIKEVKNILS